MKASCASCRRSSAPSSAARSISLRWRRPRRAARQQIIELPQPQFLRQPGSPAAVVAGSCQAQGSRVLVQSGHDLSKVWRPGIGLSAVSPHYLLIRRRRVSANFGRFRGPYRHCRMFPGPEFETAGSRPPAGYGRDKTLFTKNLHGSVTFTEPRRKSMTAPALAARSPDAEQAASAAANWLRIGQEHYSRRPQRRCHRRLSMRTRCSRSRTRRTAYPIDDDFGIAFPSRQRLDGAGRSRAGRRQLQGCIAVGA